ncbi:MAG: lysylphosphatidylglycerol synthase transmembrane domain-containing protein, partial [Bacilli bacterium]|nr:lysylphosphatidylglycerol synthase transmembrane domain-containing protein [Bacilli bacterium]
MKKHLKKIATFLLITIITCLVLYFSLKDNFEEVINQIININIIFLLIALVLMFIYWLLRSVVIYIFAKKFNSRYTYKNAFHLITSSQFFHAVTPFSSGGQPYEIYDLNKKGLKVSDATNVSIQAFITYQIALVLLGTFAIIYNQSTHIFKETGILKELVLVGFIINITVVIGLFVISFSKTIKKFIIDNIIDLLTKINIIKNKEEVNKYWDNSLNNFNEGAALLLKNKYDFIKAIIFNILSLLSLYLIPLIILFGIGDYTSMNGLTTITATAYVMLIGAFVPTPGATGGVEYSFIQFFSNFISGAKLN